MLSHLIFSWQAPLLSSSPLFLLYSLPRFLWLFCYSCCQKSLWQRFCFCCSTFDLIIVIIIIFGRGGRGGSYIVMMIICSSWRRLPNPRPIRLGKKDIKQMRRRSLLICINIPFNIYPKNVFVVLIATLPLCVSRCRLTKSS